MGRNETGRELFSAPNGTRWAPGEVLLHPKAGASPSGVVVAWMAPRRLWIEVRYALEPAAEQGNGNGYEILQRLGGVDQTVAVLANIGGGLTNHLRGILVNAGDQLFFRFNTSGDPAGDISRADIRVESRPEAETGVATARPYGGTVMAGSDFTFGVSAALGRTFHWRKDGRPVTGATNASYLIRDVKLTDAEEHMKSLLKQWSAKW